MNDKPEPIRCVVIQDDKTKTWKVDFLGPSLDRQLEQVQKQVEGWWDIVSLGTCADAVGFANEMGQLNGMAENGLATRLLRPNAEYTLKGPVVITGRAHAEVCPISDEWIGLVSQHAGRLGWSQEDADK